MHVNVGAEFSDQNKIVISHLYIPTRRAVCWSLKTNFILVYVNNVVSDKKYISSGKEWSVVETRNV